MAVQLTLLDGDTGGKRSSLEMLAGEALSARSTNLVLVTAQVTIPAIAPASQDETTLQIPEFVGFAALPLLITRNAVGLENVIVLGGQITTPGIGEVTIQFYNADTTPSSEQQFAFTFLAPRPV